MIAHWSKRELLDGLVLTGLVAVRPFQRAPSLQIETARDACLFPFAKRLREQTPDRYRQCRLGFPLSGPRLDRPPFLRRHAQRNQRVFAFPPRSTFLRYNLTLEALQPERATVAAKGAR
jgi:hypothetical protein